MGKLDCFTCCLTREDNNADFETMQLLNSSQKRIVNRGLIYIRGPCVNLSAGSANLNFSLYKHDLDSVSGINVTVSSKTAGLELRVPACL